MNCTIRIIDNTAPQAIFLRIYMYNSVVLALSNTQIPYKKNSLFPENFRLRRLFPEISFDTPPPPPGGYQGLYMIRTLAYVSRNFLEISPMARVPYRL